VPEVDGVSFEEWSAALDKYAEASGFPIRAQHLNPVELGQAYNDNLCPSEFAQKLGFGLNKPAAPPQAPAAARPAPQMNPHHIEALGHAGDAMKQLGCFLMLLPFAVVFYLFVFAGACGHK
jgi:hypothetical protein